MLRQRRVDTACAAERIPATLKALPAENAESVKERQATAEAEVTLAR
jgi:hypothetical protein